MNINASYINIYGNHCVEKIESIEMMDGWMKVNVEITEFDGLMTVKDEFVAKVPVLSA